MFLRRPTYIPAASAAAPPHRAIAIRSSQSADTLLDQGLAHLSAHVGQLTAELRLDAVQSSDPTLPRHCYVPLHIFSEKLTAAKYLARELSRSDRTSAASDAQNRHLTTCNRAPHSVRADAFSCRGTIGEDAGANLPRRKGGCAREQHRDSQCPGDGRP